MSTGPVLFPLMSEVASENSSPNLNHYAGCSEQLQSGKPALSPWEINVAKELASKLAQKQELGHKGN